jgi:hypothetical protein
LVTFFWIFDSITTVGFGPASTQVKTN